MDTKVIFFLSELEAFFRMELHFRLSSKSEIEELAAAAGFKVKALYGDYSYAVFCEVSSPYMIWLFEPVPLDLS